MAKRKMLPSIAAVTNFKIDMNMVRLFGLMNVRT